MYSSIVKIRTHIFQNKNRKTESNNVLQKGRGIPPFASYTVDTSIMQKSTSPTSAGRSRCNTRSFLLRATYERREGRHNRLCEEVKEDRSGTGREEVEEDVVPGKPPPPRMPSPPARPPRRGREGAGGPPAAACEGNPVVRWPPDLHGEEGPRPPEVRRGHARPPG
jgi:hypothetical protein